VLLLSCHVLALVATHDLSALTIYLAKAPKRAISGHVKGRSTRRIPHRKRETQHSAEMRISGRRRHPIAVLPCRGWLRRNEVAALHMLRRSHPNRAAGFVLPMHAIGKLMQMSCSYLCRQSNQKGRATTRRVPIPSTTRRALWRIPCAAALKRAYRHRVRVSYIQSPATSRSSCFGVERGEKSIVLFGDRAAVGSYGASGL
jgi:hypothetical protein